MPKNASTKTVRGRRTAHPRTGTAVVISSKTKPATKAKVAPALKQQGASGVPTATARPTKQNACLALLRRTDGATIEDLQTATGWLPHSVRGFLAGAVKKKLGLDLISSRALGAPRRYRLAAAGTSLS
jgi:Protein of unknown function (DUF3489)